MILMRFHPYLKGEERNLRADSQKGHECQIILDGAEDSLDV